MAITSLVAKTRRVRCRPGPAEPTAGQRRIRRRSRGLDDDDRADFAWASDDSNPAVPSAAVTTVRGRSVPQIAGGPAQEVRWPPPRPPRRCPAPVLCARHRLADHRHPTTVGGVPLTARINFSGADEIVHCHNTCHISTYVETRWRR